MDLHPNVRGEDLRAMINRLRQMGVKNAHRERRGEEGAVIVLVLLVASVLMIAAAAFITMSLTEAKALGYRVAERQAMLSAQSGLEHAIAVIEETIPQEAGGSAAATPDGLWPLDSAGMKTPGGLVPTDGWAGFFASQGAGAIVTDEEEEPSWMDHYGTDDYGNGAYSFYDKRATFALMLGPRTIGEYAVYVNDLDGRVHTAAEDFDLAPPATSQGLIDEVLDPLAFSSPAAQNAVKSELLSADPFMVSITELKARAGCTWGDLREAIPFFTPYPVQSVAIPQININTTRRQTLRAMLFQIPSLKNQDTEIDELVDLLAQQRPFGGRKALESVIYNHFKPKFDAAPNEGEKKKVEKRFNDVLNSLNGTEASGYRPPGDTTGVYQYDLEDSDFTGGEHTSDSDVTWGGEAKFSSRFYRIVVLGRGWRKGSGRSRTVRRWLEAVYDAADDKIIWQRVHLTPDFNILTN